MNDNYKKANILYVNAKICSDDDENILQHIANSISKRFYEKGIVYPVKFMQYDFENFI